MFDTILFVNIFTIASVLMNPRVTLVALAIYVFINTITIAC